LSIPTRRPVCKVFPQSLMKNSSSLKKMFDFVVCILSCNMNVPTAWWIRQLAGLWSMLYLFRENPGSLECISEFAKRLREDRQYARLQEFFSVGRQQFCTILSSISVVCLNSSSRLHPRLVMNASNKSSITWIWVLPIRVNSTWWNLMHFQLG
jgi:hypothetical protein